MKILKIGVFSLLISLASTTCSAVPGTNRRSTEAQRAAAALAAEYAERVANGQSILHPTTQQPAQEDGLPWRRWTLDYGVPTLLRQHYALQVFLYPYIWYRHGKHAAAEQLATDFIKWTAKKVTGRQSLITCTHGGFGCYSSQFVTSMATDIIIRDLWARPFVERYLGRSQQQ